MAMEVDRRGRLREVAAYFIWLGLTAFGGPAAHIALMRAEVVMRRRWVTEQEFLDLLGATNLIPGPNSTELAIHLGYRRAGWAGLVAGGVGFILPAMLIVLALAWAYGAYGATPAATAVLRGVQPVMLAIVAQAVWGLGRTALKDRLTWLAGAGGLCARCAGIAVAGGGRPPPGRRPGPAARGGVGRPAPDGCGVRPGVGRPTR